ncbi:MAG: organic solvent tolerance protein OstA [Euryarchaeota archaeon]|nr:organic solvent tolerance protein OstA [Euryarchaeota archaeon]
MKKNLKALLIVSSLLGLNVIYAQNSSQELDTLELGRQDKKPLLLDNIKYDATDSISIDQKNSKIILYNNAKIIYGDIELTSGLIILDYKDNIVTAGRIADSEGNLSQYPTFKQGGNVVNPDSIKYNFDNQKALIWNSKSEENGMNILSSLTKKQNDSVYYLKDGKVTTGGNLMGDDNEEADYFFKIRKGKLVPGGNIVTGFTNLFVKNVPTPIGLPFAYFPSQQTKDSGFIIPNISDSNERGYSLQNGGYYIPLSEYFDLTVLADYYTNGSYGLNISSQYKKNYKYSGNFSVRYENLISGERGLPGYGKSTVYNVRWSHSKDSKSSPNSSFSASVNFGSSDYFRQSVNQLNTANFLNNNLSSSISYSKSFPGSAGVRLSLTTSMSQNTQSKQVNLNLPTLTLNTARFYPFERKGRSKKGFIQNINIQYSSKLSNRAIFADDLLLKKGMFDNAKSGIQHTIPFTTNFKVLKHFSVSVGGNYQETWTGKTIKFNNFSENVGAVKDTISGFDRFAVYNYNASITTKVYGIVNFKPKNKVQSIRHTITPSITYSNNPSFEEYYDTYIIDAEGNTAEYTRFQGGLYGTPGKSYSSSIGLSIANTIEAKVKPRDSTETELRKINIIKNLNISTSYDLAAEEFNLSPIRVSSSFDLAKGFTINAGATFDPYALDDNNTRINKFNVKDGGGLLRLTSANVSTQYQINNNTFKRGQTQEQIDESTSGGGRADDLFGVSQDFSNSRQNMDDEEEEEEIDLTNYVYKMPWSLNLAYSLTYNNARRQNDFSTNSLMISSNFTLTPKWKVGISSGYDFKQKGFTYTQIRFDRDLDSWRLDFSWVPFSPRASWNFFIGIKSGLLSDLKYEKRSEPDRSL